MVSDLWSNGSHSSRLRVCLALLSILVFGETGCGPGSGRVTAVDHARDLQLFPGRPESGGTITVRLSGMADPIHAPVPTNASERLLFRQLYSTIVTVDRFGIVRPALAREWSSSRNGREWLFSLDDDAVYSDGSPVLTSDLIVSWHRNERIARENGDLLPWAWIAGSRFEVIDRTELRISLSRPEPELPSLLAHRSFAIAALRSGRLWPVGTGPYRVAPSPNADVGSAILEPNPHYPDFGNPPVKLSWNLKSVDSILDSEADLLPSIRKQDQVDYFVAKGYMSVSLTWDRNYLLLAPSTSKDSEDLRSMIEEDQKSLCFAVDSKAILSPGIEFSCPGASDLDRVLPEKMDVARSRIIYLAEDSDAKGLAERIMHLLRRTYPQGLTGINVEGLARMEYRAAVRNGTDLAYVYRLDRSYPCGTFHTRQLRFDAPWLAAGPEMVVPLIMTCPQAVYRHDLCGGVRGGLGIPMLSHIGWMRERGR